MARILFHLFFFFLLISSSFTLAQNQTFDDAVERLSLPPAIDERVEKYMQQAIKEMNNKQYDAANITFRKILSLNEVLPTNLSYLFAETLFMIGQYENSRNFLDKYIHLSGHGGDYFEQATELDLLLKEKQEEILTCELCDREGYRLAICHNCNQTGKTVQTCPYCKGKGVTSCLECTGKGVVISENLLGEKKYETCENCHTKGYVNCPRCHGAKIIKDYCNVCGGDGLTTTNIICDHENNQGL